MERICHPVLRTGRDRVPAVCSAGRDQVTPCGPFCPGQAHPAPFSQGAQDRAGAGSGGLSWAAPTPCSAMGSQLRCPWSHSPREPRGCQGAVQAVRLLSQHGVCKEPWHRWPWHQERGSAELPWEGVGAAPCFSPLQQGEFLASPLCRAGYLGRGRQAWCPAVAYGTAAERGTTNPKRVVAPLQ